MAGISAGADGNDGRGGHHILFGQGFDTTINN